MNTDEWFAFAEHLLNRAEKCRLLADDKSQELRFRHYEIGRASAFQDCAAMIKDRLKEVNE